MAGEQIPDVVRRLITDRIFTATELELVLHLRSDRERGYTPEAAARALYVEPADAARMLRDLAVRGFLVGSGDTSGREYRYSPASPELGRAVDQLSDLYATRRVTILGLIFSRRGDSLRRFSDAFRL